ncbi:MAG: hypothetical protein IKE65_06415 [Clostridia bacterium]|nr:hypothetical protein [Clostridia bacterium]
MLQAQSNQKTAIYRLIAEAVVNGSLPEDFTLPKEEGNSRSTRTDGWFDGFQLLSVGIPKLNEEQLHQLARVIETAATGAFESAEEQLHLLYKNTHAMNVLQPALDYIHAHTSILSEDNLSIFAQILTTQSAFIECVKFGLILLSTVKSGDTLKAIAYTLALCDEFTYFSLLSLKDDNESVFELAKHVYCWGRAEAILVLQANREEIKKWLLLEGKTKTRSWDAEEELCVTDRFLKSGAAQLLAPGNRLSREEYSAIRDMFVVIAEASEPIDEKIANCSFYLQQFLKQTSYIEPTGEDMQAIERIRTSYAEQNKEPGIVYTCTRILEKQDG